MHIQLSLLIESDMFDKTVSHTVPMPQRKLLMVQQYNMCRAIGISTDKTPNYLNIRKNIAPHYKLTLIFCCGQVLIYRIG